MPKIIENPEDRLIAETGRQLAAFGYGAMTIRSVARACGLGIGTVYNYFPSKDALVAACLLERWQQCIRRIGEVSATAETPRPVCYEIYQELLSFVRRHQCVFQDKAASAGFAGSFSRYHGILRDQLAQPLRKFCAKDFTADFIAEALLTWTVAGKGFDEIYSLMEALF